MTLEEDRAEKHRSIERAVEIERELELEGGESVVEKYKHNDGVPPMHPSQRSGNSGSDGSNTDD